MRVKKAGIEDINKIAKVELGSGYHKKKFNPFPMLRKIFKDKKEEIFVAVKSGEIIGYIGLRIENRICEIALLGVLKKYQKKGVGKKLIKYILKICQENRLNKIILEVRNDNFKALALYLKYGFIVIGIRRIKGIIKLKMQKKLR